MTRRTALGLAVLLFAMWANSFVAIGYLVGAEHASARFDWLGLTAARFGPVGIGCALYLLASRRRETIDLLRHHGGRLVVCAALNVVVYNLVLNFVQQQGVPAPIASLATALAPLFLLLLGAFFLGETLTLRRAVGFAIALAGLLVVAEARGGFSGSGRYGALLLLLALAPLSFSIYSVLSKPLLSPRPSGGLGYNQPAVSPLTWTFTVFALGGLPLAAVLPFHGGAALLALDAAGWGAMIFLTVFCTVVGFLIWMRLLRALPASVVGFTVFLNPPLTTLSKLLLAIALPATFQFTIRPLEWLGGAIVLSGVAVAIAGPAIASRRANAAPASIGE
jgi:drug/metabolite transporter (DMT)-like permease